MSFCDPIADMLTRLRNGANAGLEAVDIPHSVLKNELAKLLKKEGYVKDFQTEKDGARKILRVFLRYSADEKSVIQGVRRVSKPGLRRYVMATKIPRVLGGMGTVVLTTSKGLMTGRDAKKNNIGGEVLCYIW